MILAVVFLGIVFLDASWTFGLPTLHMLVLFLFSLLCGLTSHCPVVWRLLSLRAEPVYLKEAIGEKAVQSLSGIACLKQFPFMRVCLLALGLWGCRNPRVKQQSSSRNSELYFRGQGSTSAFTNELTLASVFCGSIYLIRAKLPILSAGFQSHTPGSSACSPLAAL